MASGKMGKSSGSSISKFRLLLEDDPDVPRGFGYKSAWLAVQCAPLELTDALCLVETAPANWESGLEATESGGLFVTPQINGWCLATGWSLPTPNELSKDARLSTTFLALMAALESRFDDVQLFATHRVAEYHAWARARGGKLKRVFAWLGEQGAAVANTGQTTFEEMELGLPDVTGLSLEDTTDRLWEADEVNRSSPKPLPPKRTMAIVNPKTGETISISVASPPNNPMPDETTVTALAGLWSIDPTRIDEMSLPASVGIAGLLPAKFRPSSQGN